MELTQNVKFLVILIIIAGAGASTIGMTLSTVSNLTTEVDDLQTDLETSLENYDTILEQYKDLQTNLNTFLGYYDTILEQYEDLLSNYTDLLSSFNILSLDNTLLNETYTELLADFNNLQKDYDALVITYDALYQDYQDLQASHATLQEQYDTLSGLYTSLLITYNGLQTDFDVLQLNFDNLQIAFTILQADYLLLNTTYWELWNSIQPDYKISVISLVASNTTLFIGEYFTLNVTLQWLSTQEPVVEGFVFVNGFQCYHVDNGTWSANVSFTEMTNYVLDRVSYLDKDGYWLDIQTNSLSLEFVVWDHINLIMVQVTALGVIGGGSTGFILKFYGFWNKTGERVDNIRVDLISNQSTTSWAMFWASQYTELFISMSRTVTYPTIYEWLHIDFYADIYKGDYLFYQRDFKMRWW